MIKMGKTFSKNLLSSLTCISSGYGSDIETPWCCVVMTDFLLSSAIDRLSFFQVMRLAVVCKDGQLHLFEHFLNG